MFDGVSTDMRKWIGNRFAFSVAVFVTTCLLGLSVFHSVVPAGIPALDVIERISSDVRVRYFSPLRVKPARTLSRVITLDSATVLAIGYPMPRSLWADAIDRLRQAGAAVIVLDVIFGEPVSEEQQAQTELLRTSIKRAGNVILPAIESEQWIPSMDSWTGVPVQRLFPAKTASTRFEPESFRDQESLESSSAGILRESLSVAVSSEIVDSDGILRSFRVALPLSNGQAIPSLSLAAFMASKGFSSGQTSFKDGKLTALQFGDAWSDTGKIVLSDLENGKTLLVPRSSESRSRDCTSLIDFLNMDLRDARSLFAGKVVFLGATAEGVASNQPVAGIATRSPILNQRDAFELLSNGSLLRRGGTGILIEVIVAVVLVCIGIWFGRSQVSVVRIGGLLCLFCAVFSIAVLCCSVFGFVIRVAGIGVLVLGVWITWMMEGFCGIERARNRIRQAFSAYVDPSIVQKITEQSSIVVEGGENRSITVMFTDLRNFTQICEGEDPHGVVSDLNQYFTLASNVIFESKGTLDKYIGDAVMAFWGAPLDLPNRKQNALEAAFRLLEDFDTLKKEWKERGRRLAYTEIGIGIHDGNALVGNIGGKRRFNYTAVGDNVNLASRLESLCKRYGVRIVVSESTRTAEMSNLLRFLDTVRVHGKKEPVVIYTCLVPEHSAPEDVYREAFGRYQEGSFKDAEALFLDMKASYPNDPTVSVLLERCQLLAIAQELSWDGVWSWEK